MEGGEEEEQEKNNNKCSVRRKPSKKKRNTEEISKDFMKTSMNSEPRVEFEMPSIKDKQRNT